MSLMRLDKLISDCGISSRKEIKQMIKSGRVTVDGVVAFSPEQKIDPEVNTVSVDGNELSYSKFRYYMLNKPAGILSATDDKKQKTVLDLVTPEMRKMGLFPVGRLDKDTTGLLLLTNDGNFAHWIISPKSEIVKTYHAEIDGAVDDEDVKAFKNGVILADGTKCLPAELIPFQDGTCLVKVMEGKYHQVKRMLASRGKPVKALRRISIGEVQLDCGLNPGDFRELSSDELCRLMKQK